MLGRLGTTFNPIAASDFAATPVTLAMFYKNVLNYEGLQKQQQQEDPKDWTSSLTPHLAPTPTTTTPGVRAIHLVLAAVAPRVAARRGSTALSKEATDMGLAVTVGVAEPSS